VDLFYNIAKPTWGTVTTVWDTCCCDMATRTDKIPCENFSHAQTAVATTLLHRRRNFHVALNAATN